MDITGEYFLACSRFTADHHGNFGGCNTVREPYQFPGAPVLGTELVCGYLKYRLAHHNLHVLIQLSGPVIQTG